MTSEGGMKYLITVLGQFVRAGKTLLVSLGRKERDSIWIMHPGVALDDMQGEEYISVYFRPGEAFYLDKNGEKVLLHVDKDSISNSTSSPIKETVVDRSSKRQIINFVKQVNHEHNRFLNDGTEFFSGGGIVLEEETSGADLYGEPVSILVGGVKLEEYLIEEVVTIASLFEVRVSKKVNINRLINVFNLLDMFGVVFGSQNKLGKGLFSFRFKAGLEGLIEASRLITSVDENLAIDKKIKEDFMQKAQRYLNGEGEFKVMRNDMLKMHSKLETLLIRAQAQMIEGAIKQEKLASSPVEMILNFSDYPNIIEWEHQGVKFYMNKYSINRVFGDKLNPLKTLVLNNDKNGYVFYFIRFDDSTIKNIPSKEVTTSKGLHSVIVGESIDQKLLDRVYENIEKEIKELLIALFYHPESNGQFFIKIGRRLYPSKKFVGRNISVGMIMTEEGFLPAYIKSDDEGKSLYQYYSLLEFVDSSGKLFIYNLFLSGKKMRKTLKGILEKQKRVVIRNANLIDTTYGFRYENNPLGIDIYVARRYGGRMGNIDFTYGKFSRIEVLPSEDDLETHEILSSVKPLIKKMTIAESKKTLKVNEQ